MVLPAIHQQGPKMGYSSDKNEGFQECCHPPPSVPSSFLLVDSWPYLPYGPGSGTHDLTHLDLHSNLCRTSFSSLGIDSSSELSSSCTLSSGDMYSMARTSCSFLFFSAMYELCMRASLHVCVAGVDQKSGLWGQDFLSMCR